jgi:hypothetical protein
MVSEEPRRRGERGVYAELLVSLRALRILCGFA